MYICRYIQAFFAFVKDKRKFVSIQLFLTVLNLILIFILFFMTEDLINEDIKITTAQQFEALVAG